LPVFLPFLLSRNLTVNGTDSKCAGIVICRDAQFDIDILGILDPPNRVDIRLDVPADDLLDDLLDDLPAGTVSGICPDHPLAACAANAETSGSLVIFLEGDIGKMGWEKKSDKSQYLETCARGSTFFRYSEIVSRNSKPR